MSFKEVYLKMSESLVNVIDPIDVIQGLELEKLHERNLDEKEIAKAKAGPKKDFTKGIPQSGTEPLKFALCAYSVGGRGIDLETLCVKGYRKSCFNATKFAMLKLEQSSILEPSAKPTANESLVGQ
ncbi:hypothetical protein D9757_014467 [Collybiopsis confluens]|uniref:valine--tRNA ligase n=1 Tax=Collybiopsis confluens TaxID=2823264 RepID=A0A8H5CV47_9AGAR|nr:hypothetical protein D9757_014467 [Collybiopsis confluens]